MSPKMRHNSLLVQFIRELRFASLFLVRWDENRRIADHDLFLQLIVRIAERYNVLVSIRGIDLSDVRANHISVITASR